MIQVQKLIVNTIRKKGKGLEPNENEGTPPIPERAAFQEEVPHEGKPKNLRAVMATEFIVIFAIGWEDKCKYLRA